MQPLDRSVFGAPTAEYRAIYRGDMAHREDKHMTKADFAADPMPAWDRASEEATARGWTRYHPDTLALERQTAVGS
jgi:hypothetical protein